MERTDSAPTADAVQEPDARKPSAGGWRRLVLCGLAAWIAATAVGAYAYSRLPFDPEVGLDFVAFWTGARALTTGRSPYDGPTLKSIAPETGHVPHLQRFAGDLGHMPYYYPIWFLFLVAPLLPLGFAAARCIWLAWMFQAYLVSVALLVRRAQGESWKLQMMVAGCMFLWVAPLKLGQPLALMMLSAILVLECWDARRDVAAGAVAALLFIKPQLGLLPAVVFSIAAWRQGRWKAAATLVGVQAALTLLGCVLRPGWPIDFLEAPRRNGEWIFTTLGMCTTWREALRVGVGTEGVAGGIATAVHLASAIFAVGWLGRLAWDRKTSLERLFAAAFLANFFVMHYVRHYDLAALLLTVCHLTNRRPGSYAAAAFLLVWWLGMYLDESLTNSLGPTNPFLRIQAHNFWIAGWTALWWLWDAFRAESFAPHSAAEKAADGTLGPTEVSR